MKSALRKYPNTVTYIFALLLFGIALFISTVLNQGIVKAYFPFTTVILLIFATWLLYKRDHKSLKEIGLDLNIKRLMFLPLGILIAASTFLVAKYVKAILLDETFHLASEISLEGILSAFYFILPTVVVEEFLFRGYLFKKTIEIHSVTKTNILFAILFTSIHLLDGDVLGNPGMIVLIVISIPVGHLLFATALLKSKSIYFPTGLHLGNNWATRHLVSENSEGNSIFFVTNTATFDTWSSFILFLLLWNSIFLLVTLMIWKWDKTPFVRG